MQRRNFLKWLAGIVAGVSMTPKKAAATSPGIFRHHQVADWQTLTPDMRVLRTRIGVFHFKTGGYQETLGILYNHGLDLEPQWKRIWSWCDFSPDHLMMTYKVVDEQQIIESKALTRNERRWYAANEVVS